MKGKRRHAVHRPGVPGDCAGLIAWVEGVGWHKEELTVGAIVAPVNGRYRLDTLRGPAVFHANDIAVFMAAMRHAGATDCARTGMPLMRAAVAHRWASPAR